MGKVCFKSREVLIQKGQESRGEWEGCDIYILKCESSAVHRGEADRESICKIKWPIAYVHWGLRRAGG